MESGRRHGASNSRPDSAQTLTSVADSVQTLGSRPAGHEELGGQLLADVWRELRGQGDATRPNSATSLVPSTVRSVLHSESHASSGELGDEVTGLALHLALQQHSALSSPKASDVGLDATAWIGPSVPAVLQWRSPAVDPAQDDDDVAIESVRTVGSLEESFVHHAFLQSLHASRRTSKTSLHGGRRASSYLGRPTSGSSMRSARPQSASSMRGSARSMHRSDSLVSGDFGEMLVSNTVMSAMEQHLRPSSPQGELTGRDKVDPSIVSTGSLIPQLPSVKEWPDTAPEDAEEPAVESVRTIGSAEESFVHHAFLHSLRSEHEGEWRSTSHDDSVASDGLSLHRSDSMDSDIGEELTLGALTHAFEQHTALSSPRDDDEAPAMVVPGWSRLETLPEEGPVVESVRTVGSAEEDYVHHAFLHALQPSHAAVQHRFASRDSRDSSQVGSAFPSIVRSDSVISGHVGDEVLHTAMRAAFSQWHTPSEILEKEVQEVAQPGESDDRAVVGEQEQLDQTDIEDEVESVVTQASLEELLLDHCLAEEPALSYMLAQDGEESESASQRSVHRADSYHSGLHEEQVMQNVVYTALWGLSDSGSGSARSSLKEELQAAEDAQREAAEELLSEEVQPVAEKDGEEEQEVVDKAHPDARVEELKQEEEKLAEALQAPDEEETKPEEEEGRDEAAGLAELVDEAKAEEEEEKLEEKPNEELKARYLIGGWTLLHQHRWKAVAAQEKETDESEQEQEEQSAQEQEAQAVEEKEQKKREPQIRVDEPGRKRSDGEGEQARASAGSEQLQGDEVMGLVEGLMQEEEYDGDFMSEDQEEKEEGEEQEVDAMEVEILAEEGEEERDEERKEEDVPQEEQVTNKEAKPDATGGPVILREAKAATPEDTMGLVAKAPMAQVQEVRPTIVAARAKAVSKPAAQEEEAEYEDTFDEEEDEEEDEERARFFRKNNKKETLNSQNMKPVRQKTQHSLKSDDALRHKTAREVLQYYSVFGPNEIVKMHGLKSRKHREPDGTRPLAVSLPHIPTGRSPQEKASIEAKRVTRLTYHRVTGPSPIHAEWFRHEPEMHGDPPERDHTQHFDPMQIERRQARQRDTYYQPLPTAAGLKDTQRHRGRSSPAAADLTKLPSSPAATERKSSSSKALMDLSPAGPQKPDALELTALTPPPSTSKSCPALTRYRVPDDSKDSTAMPFPSPGSLAKPGRTPLGASVPYSAALQLSAKLGQGPLANRKFKPVRGHEVLQMLHAGALPAIISPPST